MALAYDLAELVTNQLTNHPPQGGSRQTKFDQEKGESPFNFLLLE